MTFLGYSMTSDRIKVKANLMDIELNRVGYALRIGSFYNLVCCYPYLSPKAAKQAAKRFTDKIGWEIVSWK